VQKHTLGEAGNWTGI